MKTPLEIGYVRCAYLGCDTRYTASPTAPQFCPAHQDFVKKFFEFLDSLPVSALGGVSAPRPGCDCPTAAAQPQPPIRRITRADAEMALHFLADEIINDGIINANAVRDMAYAQADAKFCEDMEAIRASALRMIGI